MSNFSFWQPAYGERGIATFPVSMKNGQKKPAIRGWQHVDLRASAKLAKQFPDADAFGLCPGSRSRLTILDVDTTDEQVLSDALGQHGNTPIIVRTLSRHYQAWYRNNGESRRIRPFAGKPIDVLGAGFVVVPPSRGAKSSYQFIEGGLDDIGRLPVIQGLTGTCPLPSVKRVSVGVGARNNTLFALCMQAAHHCDDFDAMLDVARTRNAEFFPPLSDDEVVKVATSAWGYTERGENRFATPGAFFPAAEVNHLIATDQDAFVLLALLRANNGPRRTFMVTNTLANKLGWTRKRIAAARKRLGCNYIERVRRPSKGLPGLYRWRDKGGQNSRPWPVPKIGQDEQNESRRIPT
jgi:Bifunctional DNA primase/polymerase, N-terminal/Primase C terminal 1 (PriCT-1)